MRPSTCSYQLLVLFLIILTVIPSVSARQLSWRGLFSPIEGLQRTLGSRNDTDLRLPLERCYKNSSVCIAGFPRDTNPKMNSLWYKQPCCTALMNCVLDGVDNSVNADMQAGTTIVALVPTILLLFGFSSIDIIKLAVSEPLHAILACFFGTALPRGIFRRFNKAPSEAEKPTLVWKIQIPKYHWVIRTATNMAGLFILGGPMIWLVYNICSQTMVVWKCDRPLMVAYWPMACLCWLPISMIYLLCISKITIMSSDNKRQNWVSLILLRHRDMEDQGWSWHSIIHAKIFGAQATKKSTHTPMRERRWSRPCPAISPFPFQQNHPASSETTNDLPYPPPSRSNTDSSLEEEGFSRPILGRIDSDFSAFEAPTISAMPPIRMLSHRSNTETSCDTTSSLLAHPRPLSNAPRPTTRTHLSDFTTHSAFERHKTERQQKSKLYHEKSKYFTVTIEIKSKTHWILFQTFIETMSVMIYLYATIVLSSTLFLKATEAIIYSGVLCAGQFFIRMYISYFDNSLDEEGKKVE